MFGFQRLCVVITLLLLKYAVRSEYTISTPSNEVAIGQTFEVSWACESSDPIEDVLSLCLSTSINSASPQQFFGVGFIQRSNLQEIEGTVEITLNSTVTPEVYTFGIRVGDCGPLIGFTDWDDFIVTPPGGLVASTIHPNGNTGKCVGISGGQYTNGAAVDIYDCNGSITQLWKWIDNALTSINPADQSQWCLDAGVQSDWANGVQMKIWQCYPGLVQQSWTPIITSGIIQLIASNANFCLDLTNGNTTNQNVLQIWECTTGDVNQIWSFGSL